MEQKQSKNNRFSGSIVNGVGLFLVLYVVSYIALSRWSSYRWSPVFDIERCCFLLPVDPCETALSPALQICEYGLRVIYFPLNLIDYGLTGMRYSGLPMMRLSG